jgi:RimJ/RimL family protein N-acetyltransferase
MPQSRQVPDLIPSERLELHAPALEHVDGLLAAVRESLPELKPWMSWATEDYDRAACERGVRQALAEFVLQQDLRYHIINRADGRIIGTAGLHSIRWQVPRFEIGYWLRTSCTGKGYAAEAVRALSQVAFGQLGAERLDIHCDDRNEASARVALRCGFTLDVILRDYFRAPDGTLRDERVYSLLSLAGLRTAASR